MEFVSKFYLKEISCYSTSNVLIKTKREIDNVTATTYFKSLPYR
nr:MAG TPA: hypothetical protein [Caudoviricetes sp.]